MWELTCQKNGHGICLAWSAQSRAPLVASSRGIECVDIGALRGAHASVAEAGRYLLDVPPLRDESARMRVAQIVKRRRGLNHASVAVEDRL